MKARKAFADLKKETDQQIRGKGPTSNAAAIKGKCPHCKDLSTDQHCVVTRKVSQRSDIDDYIGHALTAAEPSDQLLPKKPARGTSKVSTVLHMTFKLFTLFYRLLNRK